MRWLSVFFKSIARLLLGLLLLISLSLAWTWVLYFFAPWVAASNGAWPPHRPIVVSSIQQPQARVILYRELAEQRQSDPALRLWSGPGSGRLNDGGLRTEWRAVTGEAWQLEARWEDGDYLMESRYRLEAQTPLLIESRERDPGLAIKGLGLAVLSLSAWRLVAWWRRRQLG